MGVKYFGLFQQSRNNGGMDSYRVLFDYTGYAGASAEVRMGRNAFRVNDVADDKEVGVKELRAEFEMTNGLADIYASDFFTEAEKSIKVTVERVSISTTLDVTVLGVEFVGYVTPKRSEDPYIDGARTIRITASDGLSYLKNEPFITDGGYVLTGVNTWLFALKAVLDKVGIGLPFTTVGSLRRNGQDASGAFEPMAFTNLRLSRFRGMTYYQVLEHIAQHWNAALMQSKGEWWLIRNYDLTDTVYQRKWAANGDFISGGVFAGAITVGHGLDYQPLSDGLMSYEQSQKKLTATLKLGGYDSKLLNGDFSAMTGADFTHWQEFFSAAVSRVGTGTAEDPYKAKISGAADKVMEATLIYQIVQLGTGDDAIKNRITFSGKADTNNVAAVAFRVNLNILGLGFPMLFALNDAGKWVRGGSNAITFNNTDVNKKSKKSPVAWEITSDKISEIEVRTGTGVLIPQEDWGMVQIEISLMQGILETEVDWTSPSERYVQYYDLRLEVANEALNKNATELKYTLTNEAVAVNAAEDMELIFADMPDADQESAILTDTGAITTANWITTADGTQREIVEHLMRERLAMNAKPPRIYDATVWGHLERHRPIILSSESGTWMCTKWEYDYGSAQATCRWKKIRLPSAAGTMTMAKTVKLRDGSEQPVDGVDIPGDLSHDTKPSDLLADIFEMVNRIRFEQGMILKKNTTATDEVNYLKWESATTTDVEDYIAPTATGFKFGTVGQETLTMDVSSLTAPANIKIPNVTAEAIMATNETAWMLGGNALTAAKSIGSTTNYDISVIRNSVTKANFGATTTDFDAEVYNFKNGGTTYATLNSTGLGIGTTSPSYLLEVSGANSQTAQITSTNGDLANLNLKSTGNSTWSLSADVVLRFKKDSTEYMRINSSGNVGIGTTTPDRKLVVNGDIGFAYTDGSSYSGIKQVLVSGQYGLQFFSAITSSGANRSYEFMDNAGSPIVSILNGGNVGIGTTSPTYKLDVAGTSRTTNLKITNGATVGYVWQCNNTDGTGAWTTPLTSERYIGEWAANSGSAPSGSPTTGDYWVVNTAGTYSGTTYAAGDEIYWNGSTWLKRSNYLTLPTATSSILGGIKIGSNLAIDGSGVVTVTSSPILTTSRNIAMTGDIAWNVDFNGSGNVTAAGTLATVNSNVGTFRSVTVNAKGLVIAATNPTTLAGYGITDVYTKTQSDGLYVHLTGNETVIGQKTFNSQVTMTSGAIIEGANISNINITRLSEGGGTHDDWTIANYRELDAAKQMLFLNETTGNYLLSLHRNGVAQIFNGVVGLDQTYGNASNLLRVDSNIEYSGTLKPLNQTPTAGYFLKADSTSTNTWAAITHADISNLSSYTGFDARYFTETEADARFVALGGSYSNPSWLTSLAWSKLSGVPASFAPSAHTLDSHSNVTISSNTSGEILKWDGTAWVNNTLSEAGIQTTLDGTGYVKLSGTTLSYDNREFVDTNTTQSSIGGAKTFTAGLTAQSLTSSSGLVTAGEFSTYGITYNTLGGTMIQSGSQLYFAFKPLVQRASHFVFDRGFVKIGGNTSGLPVDIDFATERLHIDGNIRYSGTLKPSNTAGTGFLKSDGTNDAWSTILTSDVYNLEPILSGKQDSLIGTGLVRSVGGSISYIDGNNGQVLIKDGSGTPNFMNLELKPMYLTHKRLAVGTEFDNYGEVRNLTFEAGRVLRVSNISNQANSMNLGITANDTDGILEYNGIGDMWLKSQRDIYIDNFKGGGDRFLKVTNDGKVYTTASGGGSSSQDLDSVLSYGNTANNKTMVFKNDTTNIFTIRTASDTLKSTFGTGAEHVTWATSGNVDIELNSSRDLRMFVASGRTIMLGESAPNKPINLYGENYLFNKENLFQGANKWGSADNQSTPQNGDIISFIMLSGHWRPIKTKTVTTTVGGVTGDFMYITN